MIKKFVLSLLLSSVLLVSLCSANVTADRKDKWEIKDDDPGWGRNCEYDWDDREWDCDDGPLSTGAIIGIVIGVLVLFFGIPILCCFCCACCCFKNRRKPKQQVVTVTAVPTAPVTHYPIQQPLYQNPGGQPQVFITNVSPQQQYPYHQQGMPMPQPQPFTYNGQNNYNAPPPQPGFATVASDDHVVYGKPPPYFEATRTNS